MSTIHQPHGFRRPGAAALCGVIASTFPLLSPAWTEAVDTRQVTVKFADLNISRPEGAAILYGRLRAAAETVCSPYGTRNLAEQESIDNCINSAMHQAVTTINQPALSLIYSAKTRIPLQFTSDLFQ